MNPQPAVKMGWKLHAATHGALLKFRAHLPKGAVFDVPASQQDEFVSEWATALAGITPDAVLDAAARWLRDEELLDREGRTRIPTIAAFARYARRVDREHWRPPENRVVSPPALLVDRINELSARAIRELGTLERVEEVWGDLFSRAEPGEACQRVREGRVTDEEFNQAMATVRARITAATEAGGQRP